MKRSVTILSSSVAVAAAAVTALAVAPSGAGAAGASCTAWAAMPSTLYTHNTTPATLRMTLQGTAGCRAGTFDNGATAYLVGPSGTQPIYQRWTRFGDTQTQDFYASIDRPGTYRVVSGNVQTYDANSERIPAHWNVTSVRIVPAPAHHSARRA